MRSDCAGASASKSLKSSAVGAGSEFGAVAATGSSVRSSATSFVTAGVSSTRRSPVSTLSAEISSSPETISKELNRPLLSASRSSISSLSFACLGISSLSSKL